MNDYRDDGELSADTRLLMRLDEKVTGLFEAIDGIRSTVATKAEAYRVERLEKDLEKAQAELKEIRDDSASTRNRVYWLMGVLSAVQFGITLLARKF